MENIEQKVLEILREVSDELVTYEGENMLKDGLINSLGFVNLIPDLEDVFDIEIDPALLDAEHFGNKNKIIATIKSIVSLTEN